MQLIVIDKQDKTALKKFALTMSIAFPVVFMGVLPLIFGLGIPLWPAAISALLLVLYVIFPAGIYYPQLVWAYIAFALGWVNTRVLLFLVFYVLIFPVGFIARRLGKLNYNRGDTQKPSGWVKRTDKVDKQSLERPF